MRQSVKEIRKRLNIISDGQQAPYGAGEIITTFCDTPAGRKKALKYTTQWHNGPSVIDDNGLVLSWREAWDGDDEIIREVRR